ncbi:MAG: PIN domain-containing protein [Pseudomonadota bacterium]|nr:PIN domain-containing protein [Pseudomonadota bacterium]
MECRVKPLRDNDADLLGDYDRFFEEALNECVALTRPVLALATDIRARYGFKTPDAIHLAASVTSCCDRFLTNDRRLEHFSGIGMDVIQIKP